MVFLLLLASPRRVRLLVFAPQNDDAKEAPPSIRRDRGCLPRGVGGGPPGIPALLPKAMEAPEPGPGVGKAAARAQSSKPELHALPLLGLCGARSKGGAGSGSRE
eukprot:scaffold4862_cov134-Pinguiococcus_pyrenoidosus.AAC.1